MSDADRPIPRGVRRPPASPAPDHALDRADPGAPPSKRGVRRVWSTDTPGDAGAPRCPRADADRPDASAAPQSVHCSPTDSAPRSHWSGSRLSASPYSRIADPGTCQTVAQCAPWVPLGLWQLRRNDATAELGHKAFKLALGEAALQLFRHARLGRDLYFVCRSVYRYRGRAGRQSPAHSVKGRTNRKASI